jgi:hypothetical protein
MSAHSNILTEYLAAVTSALNRDDVDYALCGGLALALHGHPRFTQDIDLLVRPVDFDSFILTVKQIGFTLSANPMTLSTTRGEIKVRRVSAAVESELVTLDVLLVSPATQFAWDSRRDYSWEGGTLRCVSRDGLAHLKRISSRPQDRVDLQTLGVDDELVE